MKYAILFIAGLASCAPEVSYPKRYEVIQAYSEWGTDLDLERIDAHYHSEDGDPSSFGFIRIEDEGGVLTVDVYKGTNGLYIYEYNPDNGEETKRYLSSAQIKWVLIRAK